MAAVYVLLIALLLPFLMTRLHLVLSHLILIWTCIVILAKTIFQLSMVNFKSEEDDCPSVSLLFAMKIYNKEKLSKTVHITNS